MAFAFGQLTASLPDGAKQEFTLSKASVSLGRGSTNDIVVADTAASRNHALLECGPEGCVLVDLGSANGTRVNGNRVERVTLSPGDVITAGGSTLRFDVAGPEPDPEITRVLPEGDLEETLAQMPLSMELQETGMARLAVHTSARTWEVPLTGDAIAIGRHPENDVVLDSHKVSRRHARIERIRDQFAIVDLNSDNGTWVGSERVTRRTLADGDAIQIGNARMVFKAGFASEDLTVVEPPAGGKVRRRPVVVVPGFGGSNLYRGSHLVWPLPRVMFGHPEMIRLDEQLEPRGMLRDVVIVPGLVKLDKYSLLVDYLTESLVYESGSDLLEFAYDFRQDIRLSAQKLAEAIDLWNPGAPITIVTHSMGSLLTRFYVERLGGKKKVERIVFMGGPHLGTPYSFAGLLKGPGTLPFGFRDDRMREVLATFPSFYQLLPVYPFVFEQGSVAVEILKDPSWLTEDRRHMLRYATEFRAELGTRSSVPAVCIFGYGLKTITRALVERNSRGLCNKLDLNVTPGGDNTVPEESAALEGTEIHPVRQHHGALYVDSDVKMRLKLELMRRPSVTY
jgi:pSer/pThr/pTyr-binding forkhead associated (FHA) protein